MLSLPDLLATASKCPLYESWNLGNISRIGDSTWTKLPTLCSDSLKKVTPLFTGSTPQTAETVYYSSGTTDVPKLIFFSDDDLQRIYKLCCRFSSVEGIDSDSRVMVLLPMGLWSVGKVTVQGLLLQGAKVFPVDLQGNISMWNKIAQEIQPNVISSTPSVLAAWAPHYSGPPLTLLETTGEPLLYSERNSIQDGFKGPVYDAYGLTECVVGVECESHTGFHYWPDAIHVEILDPETQETLPSGESGEIVLTSFMQERLPIIRYQSGDKGRILTPPCECGRKLPRVFFEGRLQSAFNMPRGVQIEEADLREALAFVGISQAEMFWKERPGSPAELVMEGIFKPTLEITCREIQLTEINAIKAHLFSSIPELAELAIEDEIHVNVMPRALHSH